MPDRLSEVPAIIRRLYGIVDELEEIFPGRHFTPDGHLVGSLGESLAAAEFDLVLEPASTEAYDATAPDGRTVEIKATQRSSVGLSANPDPMPDHLVVLKLQRDGGFTVVYNGPAGPGWQASGQPQKNGQRSIRLSTLARLNAEQPDWARLPGTNPDPER